MSDLPAAEQVRIELLGRFRISVDGEPVRDSISMRGREVLAVLALADGGTVPRERIASRLWPESTEAQARTNLRRELFHLRRHLPAGQRVLDASGAKVGLRLQDGVSADLHDLRRVLARAGVAAGSTPRSPEQERAALTQAARLYAGDLLPESFTEWLTAERERLRADVVIALRHLTALLEDRRDFAGAIRWARRLTEIDPLDEIAYRAQMRACAAAGDRAAALHAFHRCANLLSRELGIEPAPETRELYRDVLEDGAVGAGRPAELRSPLRAQAPESWELVGRAAARAQLLAAWRDAGARTPRLACVLGEPGIGKSRLAEDVARQAEREGATVARARAYAAEGPLSYAPVVDWLRSPALFSRIGELDPVWHVEIGRLLPEVREGQAAAPEPEPPQTEGGAYLRRRLFEAAARALLSGARPLLLLLDDLQWCDAETLAFLHYLSRCETDAPVLIVATARTAEVADNGAAQRLLLSLRQAGTLLEIELGPLAASDMVALLGAAAGEERDSITADAAERLCHLSEGNPLFAVEALRVGLHRAEIPAPDRAAAPSAQSADGALQANLLARSPRVRAVIDARFADLDPRARELAQCAATIGRAFSFDVLREASDLGERELVPALDELWRRRIVREHPALGYDFSHDALREAATRMTSPARAKLLHRRVAQALELVYSDNLDEVSASLASHYEQADVPKRATGYYLRAARAASAVYAHHRAATLLDRALALVARRPPSRQRDREELALLLAQTPSLRAVHGYTDSRLVPGLERACRLAERVEDTAALFQGLRNLIGLRFVGADLSGTMEVAARMGELAAALPDLEAESEHVLAGTLEHMGEFAEAIRHFEAARRCYDPRDAPRQVHVFGSDLGVFNCAWEAHALWLSGMEDRALASADEAVRTARAIGHAYSEALAQAYAALLHYMRRDPHACGHAADAARELCDRHGFAYYRHWGAFLGAWARRLENPEEAVRTMRAALDSLDEEQARVRRPMYLAALAEALAAADRPGEALEVLDRAETLAVSTREQMWTPELFRLRAVLDSRDAVAHAERALDEARRLRARPLAVRSAVTLAQAMRSAGDGERAHQLLRDALAALPDSGSSRDRTRALRLLQGLD